MGGPIDGISTGSIRLDYGGQSYEISVNQEGSSGGHTISLDLSKIGEKSYVLNDIALDTITHEEHIEAGGDEDIINLNAALESKLKTKDIVIKHLPKEESVENEEGDEENEQKELPKLPYSVANAVAQRVLRYFAVQSIPRSS